MDFKFQTELGAVTVDDSVVTRVAGYAALDCYGIVGMASKRSTDGIVQLMGRKHIGKFCPWSPYKGAAGRYRRILPR